MPVQTRDGQRPHPARSNVRNGRRKARKHGLRLSADQVIERRCDAAVRNVHHERVDLLLEQFHRQVGQ